MGRPIRNRVCVRPLQQREVEETEEKRHDRLRACLYFSDWAARCTLQAWAPSSGVYFSLRYKNIKRTEYLKYAAAASVLALLGCARGGSQSATIDPTRLKAYAPLPDVISGKEPITEEKIVLGRMLYYDTRLSKSQKLSCNSCHDLAKYGVDNQPTSAGHKGQKGDRNSPTVYNAAGHFVQFWDGRAP